MPSASSPTHGGEVAALIVEPLMQGAAGMWAQPLGYLPALRELARRHGTLLICDEVATGFGRTGRMFAVEHEGVEPDLLCLGKGITGGYLPLAATLASEEIFEAFLAPYERFEAFFHGHTYTGNPLACAVALANLDVFAAEQVVQRAADRAAQLAGLLAELTGQLPCVGDVRQWGLMVGIELVRDPADPRPVRPRPAHRPPRHPGGASAGDHPPPARQRPRSSCHPSASPPKSWKRWCALLGSRSSRFWPAPSKFFTPTSVAGCQEPGASAEMDTSLAPDGYKLHSRKARCCKIIRIPW